MRKNRNYNYRIAASVAVLTVLVHFTAVHNDFVAWDDAAYVLDNPFIRSFNPAFFKWAFLNFYADNWHPLTWISHAIDYALWGLNPFGHHLTSIVLHAVNAFLVVVLVIRLLEVAREKTAETRVREFLDDRTIPMCAGATGLLFGLHPVHVESVAWISERKDLLCAVFFLLSMTAYLKYAGPAENKAHRAEGMGQRVEKGKAHGAEGMEQRIESGTAKSSVRFAPFTDRRYLASLALFALALLSKPMAVTLPVVLLILDRYPLGRIRNMRDLRQAAAEKLPFFALALFSSAITLLAQNAGRAVVPIESVTWPTRLLVAAEAFTAYLAKMILPVNLLPFYPYPASAALLSIRGALAVFSVVAITVICVMSAKKQKVLLTAWAYFVLTLIPVLGIVQVGGQSMADRYMYLPSLSPFLVAGLGAGITAKKIIRENRAPGLRAAGVAAAVLVLASLSLLTVRQIGIWRNSFTLWDFEIEREPGAATAYNNRGIAFQRNGDFERAIEDYDRALSLNPSYAEALFNRGTAFEKTGRFQNALADYDRAIAINPSYQEAYLNRGLLFRKRGLPAKAVEDFKTSIALSPSSDKGYFLLGMISVETGSYAASIDYFSRVVALNPGNDEAYVNRGTAYALLGRPDKAFEDFNRAMAINRTNPVTYYNRGRLQLLAGNREGAASDFRKACDLGYADGCRGMNEKGMN